MVTDGILCAVQGIIDNLETREEKCVGNAIWNLLADFDEDKWYSMNDKERQEWLNQYKLYENDAMKEQF